VAVAKKKTTQKRRVGGGRGRTASKAKSGMRRRAIFVLRHLLLWFVIVVAAVWLWLDFEVARTFETRQWSLPARVYARPLELYPGAKISRARLLSELQRLGYERVAQISGRGQFAASKSRIEFQSRGFAYWDQPEQSRHVMVAFTVGSIQSLTDLSNQVAVDLMRLEAIEIGRINPRRFEDRQLLRYADMPSEFIQSLVAVEDRRFFKHHGIDLFGLARAMVSNVRAMKFVQGGSTLTQQLVKNLYLTRERTVRRKLVEMMMAASLERRYSKEKILETYVNEVFLGQDGNRAVHGFGLAAQYYFGKPLAELDRPAMALLIGMVKGPSAYNPVRHPQAARARRNVVLSLMRRHGVMSPVESATAQQQTLGLKPAVVSQSSASPAFLAQVKRQLANEYSADDLKSAGLNVFTTLDASIQKRAERAVTDTLKAIERGRVAGQLQAAMVIAEPRSGEILAMIGDRRPGYAGFNRALDAQRPVGSVIKPFVYAYALSQPQHYSLATTISDVAVDWTDAQGTHWRPENFDGREYGPVSLLDALTRSLNLATVNLGLQLGVAKTGKYLTSMGVSRRLPPYPSMFLGAIDMSPFEVTELYTALANDGFQVPLRAIFSVTDQHNKRLNRYGLKIRRVMSPATAALVRHALSRVVARGTARRLLQDFPDTQPLAGKTGTSDDNRDSWFAGFGANRLAVAWVGRDDNGTTGLTGGSGALRLWSAAMQRGEIESLPTTLPADLSWQNVDLNRTVILPEACTNGERMPVHKRSALPRLDSCTSAGNTPTTQGKRSGLIERLRGLFN
jgi:penicillin-binding protein 1B